MATDRRYMTIEQVAERLELTADYLYRMRVAGVGPPYRVHGRKIRYLREDVENWDRQSIRVQSKDEECTK